MNLKICRQVRAVLALLLCFAICARGETVTEEPDAFLEYIEATGSQYIDTEVNAETGATPVELRIVGIEMAEGSAQVRVAATAGGEGVDLSQANGVLYVATGDTVTNLVGRAVQGAAFSGDGQTATISVASAAGAFIRAVIGVSAPPGP